MQQLILRHNGSQRVAASLFTPQPALSTISTFRQSVSEPELGDSFMELDTG